MKKNILILLITLVYSVSCASEIKKEVDENIKIEENLKNEISKLKWIDILENVKNYTENSKIKFNASSVEDVMFCGDLVLITIAEIESDFISTVGKIDKDDLTYYQINVREWKYSEISKLTGMEISAENINEYATYIAAHIWLYNLNIFINIRKSKPVDIYESIAVYHKPSVIVGHYKRKAINIIKEVDQGYEQCFL